MLPFLLRRQHVARRVGLRTICGCHFSSSSDSMELRLYDAVFDKFESTAPSFEESLQRMGLGFLVLENFVEDERFVKVMREESEQLWKSGRFEDSYSEIIDAESGKVVRHYKEGVQSMELAGDELEDAPLLLHYTAAVVRTLPAIINHYFGSADAGGSLISSASYGTKLAITKGGGARYPKHVDNVGLPDLRKLTVILYLNSGWDTAVQGGELRLWGNHGSVEDVSPSGGTLVVFWSDQVVHEVLPNSSPKSESRELREGEGSSTELDRGARHALTLWLVAEPDRKDTIAEPDHPLACTREEHFAK